jgi:hypothetical protein
MISILSKECITEIDDSSLGCGIGYGYLHRIPHNMCEIPTSQPAEKPKKTFSSALGIAAEEQQQSMNEAAATPTIMNSASQPVAATLFTPPSTQSTNPGVGVTAPVNQAPALPVSTPAAPIPPQTSASVDIPGMPPQQQTITTPLNIPGMPPITVSAPVMMAPSAPPPISGSAVQGHHPPLSSTLPQSTGVSTSYASPQPMGPPQQTNIPWPNVPQQYQQQQQPLMATGYYQPQPQIYDPYNQNPNQVPMSNVPLFNPVANSTPNPDASANFVRMFDPTAQQNSPAASNQ